MKVQVPIITRRTIAANTVEVTFDTSANPLNFVAGQYVSVTVPGPESLSLRQRTHDFSIASSALHQEHLSIAFRLSNSPFKQQLSSLPVGTLVTLTGPKGIFILPDSSQIPLVFIAGGIGITPFISMLSYTTEAHLGHKIDLFYFNLSKASEVYGQELRLLAKQNNNLVLHEIYVSFKSDFITKNISDIPRRIWYVAGPPGFVTVARYSLLQLGVPASLIHTEEFTGYA